MPTLRVHILSITAIAASVLASGCTTSLIPRQVRDGVDKTVVFGDALQNPEAARGKTVLWAGEIIRLTNAKKGTTIEVLQIPANAEGKPLDREKTQGRFLVFFDRYLDEAVYHPRRSVSVVGVLEGQKLQPLGEDKMEYAYPLLRGQHVYLWPEPSPSTMSWRYGPDPFWWDRYYVPVPVHVHGTQAPRPSPPRPR